MSQQKQVGRPAGRKPLYLFLPLLLTLLLLAGCRQAEPEAAPSPDVATPTPERVVAVESPTPPPQDPNFIVVATDAPNRPFGDIDPFGNVEGFDADVMADLAAEIGFAYEFVVTPHEGSLENLANRQDYNAVMSALIIPEEPPEGIAFTVPYLEVGQILVVRANERAIQTYHDIQPGTPIGAERFSSGEVTAREVVGVAEGDLILFQSTTAALQALIDGAVNGVIVDSIAANHFTNTYPQQLKIAGGPGREAWISAKAYGIAVAADNEWLLETLNEAIGKAHEEGTIERLSLAWLLPQDTIVAGESLIGTPPNELVIGIAGQLRDMDPAAQSPELGSWTPDLIGWEVQMNTMSGLLMVDENNDLTPILAADQPLISDDGLEYTFSLRPGLTFPDGSEFTADDVRWSILRAARLGNWMVNGVLKNSDGIATEDAVQVLNPLTVKFVLQEPTAYFPSMLATPPFFILSQECYSPNFDPTSACGGIGPYNIVQWEQGEQMRLKANPQWPGPGPAFENIQLRFYDDPARMRRSLENSAIDIAWSGLRIEDILELRDQPEFIYWEGPAVFKSYLIFEQSQPPWDDVRIRRAVAYAIDRENLVEEIFRNTRRPLYSPVPDDAPGHAATEPERDIDQARALLAEAGYSANNPLEIVIWYESEGRYSPFEDRYAAALKRQLEETGVFQVTIQGAPYDIFRTQSLTCNYPAYLLGWPPSGWPPSYLDPMTWIEYFVTATNRICSNYESPAMDQLMEAVRAELDDEARMEIYAEIQQLWAEEFPTLNLTQEPRIAISLRNVSNVGDGINALGLLHYSVLMKGGG